MKKHIKHLYRRFKSDGCTDAPDMNFKKCCVIHDYDYTVGGNELDRIKADKKLLLCIKNNGHPILAIIYYLVVRLFGKKHFNYK